MDLGNLRNEIDRVDEGILSLFKERMRLAGEVADVKKESGAPVADRSRERDILARVSLEAGEGLDAYARTLFTTLLDISRAHQALRNQTTTGLRERIGAAKRPPSAQLPASAVVACQGVEGAYSQLACDKLFAAPNIMYFHTFEAVFRAVESGLCEYGVLPIENSTSGSVRGVYDLLGQFSFHIVRSARIHVLHRLLAKPGVSFPEIREIYSHTHALEQCSEFLAGLRDVKVTPAENTAIAAQMVHQSQGGEKAAISSQDCAELYGLSVLREDVQNTANNYTRFILISNKPAIYPGADRISLILSVKHEPGALYRLLSKFAATGLNLIKLESRPIPNSAYEFAFYIDLEGSVWDAGVMRLLEELSATNPHFAFLGSYHER